MFDLIKKDGNARLGTFKTVHGTIKTPVFMNVATIAAIKGAVSTADLKELGCQVALSNTYHLNLRPTSEVVKQMGGIHKFMNWDRPVLTDSGGFQVFSLSGLRKISTEKESLWALKRVCRFSLISHQRLQWLLMNALKILLRKIMLKNLRI